MGIALEICNKVMSEVQGIKDTGFPLDAFPERVQTIILDMVRYENFKVEYLAPAMLSAVSSALGGTYYVRVKGQWITNAALYIIMVGRPGLGKTPPLEAAFCPIRWNDNAKIEKFKADMPLIRMLRRRARATAAWRSRYCHALLYQTSLQRLCSMPITTPLAVSQSWWMRLWACSIPPTATTTDS